MDGGNKIIASIFFCDGRDYFKLMTMRGSWVLLLQIDGIEGNKYHLPKTNTEAEGCMCLPHMFSLCVQCKSISYPPKDLQGPFFVFSRHNRMNKNCFRVHEREGSGDKKDVKKPKNKPNATSHRPIQNH